MIVKDITKEQKIKLASYQNKWLQNKLESHEIDQHEVMITIQKIYNAVGVKDPSIIFCNNPYELLEKILAFSNHQLGHGLTKLIEKIIINHLTKEIKNQLNKTVWKYLWFELCGELEKIIVDNIENVLWYFLEEKIEKNLNTNKQEYLDSLLWIEYKLVPKNKFDPESEFVYNCLSSNVWSSCGSYFDFCISVLNCNHSHKLWEIYKMFCRNCGWIFPYEKICFVSAPPQSICLDEQQLLHADNSPAIYFLDGLSLFANHGIILNL